LWFLAHQSGDRIDFDHSGRDMVNLVLTPCRQSHFRASPQGCGDFSRKQGDKCGIRATDGDKLLWKVWKSWQSSGFFV
jgi:hypothetical protein